MDPHYYYPTLLFIHLFGTADRLSKRVFILFWQQKKQKKCFNFHLRQLFFGGFLLVTPGVHLDRANTFLRVYMKNRINRISYFVYSGSLDALTLLGANAPLGPASSEGLYVCLYVCLYVTL